MESKRQPNGLYGPLYMVPLDAPVTIATLLDSLLVFTIVIDPTPCIPERPLMRIASRGYERLDLCSLG